MMKYMQIRFKGGIGKDGRNKHDLVIYAGSKGITLVAAPNTEAVSAAVSAPVIILDNEQVNHMIEWLRDRIEEPKQTENKWEEF